MTEPTLVDNDFVSSMLVSVWVHGCSLTTLPQEVYHFLNITCLMRVICLSRPKQLSVYLMG
jgi:hypothetical protein